jgi:hypothetical protein
MNYTKGNWTIHDTNKYETPHIECGIYRICRIADNREYKANARLISAAPDMETALRHAEIVLSNLDTRWGLNQQQRLLQEEINKALTKAEGK